MRLSNEIYSLKKNLLNDEKFMKEYEKELSWDLISRYQKFTIDDIEKFKDKINFSLILHNPNVSEEVKDYIKSKYNPEPSFDWFSLCRYDLIEFELV